MIFGMHTILYSQNADAVRAFFRDVLKFPSVDAGHGWLIFAAPPAELAVHPVEGSSHAELYLMCKDLDATVKTLQKKGVEFPSPITEQRWGRLTPIRLPDGQTLGLYQPSHPIAIPENSAKSRAGKMRRAKKETPTRARTKAKLKRHAR